MRAVSRWVIQDQDKTELQSLAIELRLSPLTIQCLVNRGYATVEGIRAFIQPKLKDLADPFLLPDMDRAVAALVETRKRHGRVIVFGDYDVDGVTSSALLKEGLTQLGFCVNVFLPHRLEEGYGLNRASIEKCFTQEKPDLLLAVDCGSTAADTVEWIQDQGVRVVILDHHQVSQPKPRPYAFVNPQLASENEPSFRELCSAGLAFKLIHALAKHGRAKLDPASHEIKLKDFLDLVALGTVADLVPLRGENRILLSHGLRKLNQTRRPGLMSLRSVAGIEGEIGVYEVGFLLGPRLNAAGRLETADEALQLLLAPRMDSSDPLARNLDARNRRRQEIERMMAEEVMENVRSSFRPDQHFTIVEGGESWHVGVVGIVASRVVREFYRPAIILGGDQAGEWRGSGRSIEGFDLAGALLQCSDLLVKHGGHAMAVGLSLDPGKLPAFRARLNQVASRYLSAEMLRPRLKLDAEVRLADLNESQMEEFARLEPMGQGNAPVQFCARNVCCTRPPRRMGREQKHLKLWLTDGTETHEAVWWNAPENVELTGKMDVAFLPQVNAFRGRRQIQLRILEVRSAGT